MLRLLKLVSPSITNADLLNEEERIKAINKLLNQAHPSNFMDNIDAENVHVDVKQFCAKCCEQMEMKSSKKRLGRRKKQSKIQNQQENKAESVVQFNIRQKWSHLDGYVRPLPPEKLTSGKVLAPLVAYQCINARGAIAHGKRPSLVYSWENVESCRGMSVMDVFKKHGGFKTISGSKVHDIKVEIIENGPVVSHSFIPTTSFATEHSKSIVPSRIKKHHYCMIIGWTLTEYGEAWLVQSYNGGEIMDIPVGRFSIDETIIAPKSSFVNLTWQQGPYFDRDMTLNKGWHNVEEITLKLSENELGKFAETFGDKDFSEAIIEKTRFVIRDKNKNAHSRSCSMQSLQWNKMQQVWDITCLFNDKGSYPLVERNLSI